MNRNDLAALPIQPAKPRVDVDVRRTQLLSQPLLEDSILLRLRGRGRQPSSGSQAVLNFPEENLAFEVSPHRFNRQTPSLQRPSELGELTEPLDRLLEGLVDFGPAYGDPVDPGVTFDQPKLDQERQEPPGEVLPIRLPIRARHPLLELWVDEYQVELVLEALSRDLGPVNDSSRRREPIATRRKEQDSNDCSRDDADSRRREGHVNRF